MKKAFLLMLSLFSALSLMFLSCKTDSSSGGGTPEFDVTICDTRGSKEQTTWERNSGEDVYICVTSKNYLKDLDIKGVYDDNLESIEFSVDDTVDIDIFKVYKIWLKGASSTPGTYSYSLVVCSKSNPNIKAELEFTVKITGSSSGSETVAVPVITVQPVAGNYKEGETIAALTVEAEISSGSMTYQWYKDENIISGATNASYTPTGKGSYYVVVSNASDSSKSVKSNVVSIVVLAANELPPPEITKDLDNEVSYAKSSDIEAIKVEATKPKEGEVHAAWYKNGAVVVNDDTTLSYKPGDFGSYYCMLWTDNGSKKSQKVASKTIEIKESEIEITISGLSKESYVGNKLEVSVSTNVDVESITYQWYKTGEVSSGNDEIISGETSASYTPTATGNYTCKVTVNSKGGQKKTSANGGICKVKEKHSGDAGIPVITTQPGDATVAAGGEIKLAVVANSPDDGTLSYQWKKDGQSIPNANGASYVKNNAAADDSGDYSVDITNTLPSGKFATKTSKNAKVTVTGTGSSGSIGGGVADFN